MRGSEPYERCPLPWVVEGRPVAKVGSPYSIRWPLRPGRLTVEVRMLRQNQMARPVTVVVDD